MSLKGKRKCVCCERFYNEDEMNYVGFGECEGKLICCECEADDFSDAPAKVVLYKNGEKLLNMVVAYYNYMITDNEGDMVADATDWYEFSKYKSFNIELLESYAKTVDWKPSSAWRGHYEGNIDDEMVKVIDSWFGSDGYNIHDDLEKIRINLEDRKEYPDFMMMMCFLRTSNVCSTGVEVYVKKSDEKEYRNWLEVSK